MLYPGEKAVLTSKHEIRKLTKPVKEANYSDLSMDQRDSDLTDDLLLGKVQIVNVAKVKLNKEISIKKPKEGDVFFYTYTLENVGTQLARDIRLNDIFDSKMLISEGKADCSIGKCGDGALWTIDQLNPGEKAILQVPVKLILMPSGQKYVVDPVEELTMEQDNFFELEKMLSFRYKAEKVEKVKRGIAGEKDNE